MQPYCYLCIYNQLLLLLSALPNRGENAPTSRIVEMHSRVWHYICIVSFGSKLEAALCYVLGYRARIDSCRAALFLRAIDQASCLAPEGLPILSMSWSSWMIFQMTQACSV